jgi:hypothetical protein
VNAIRRAYVDAVVRNYLRLPGTPLRASRRDRRLAAELYERRIPLRLVWAAFVVATARRTIRSPTERKLEKIRTLYYFLPALDEAIDTPFDPDYVEYLASRIRPFVAEKERVLAEDAASQ